MDQNLIFSAKIPEFAGQQEQPVIDDGSDLFGGKDTLSIQEILETDNLAFILSKAKRYEIGYRVKELFDLDRQSQKDWEDDYKKIMELTKLRSKIKNFPWPYASNVKLPKITQACLQYSSRTVTNIIQGDQLVKGKITGEDPDGMKASRADRLAAHINYQMLEESNTWKRGLYHLTLVLPAIGDAYRKTWFDQREMRVVSAYVPPSDMVFDFWGRDFHELPRKSHIYYMYPHEVEERERMQIFVPSKTRLEPDQKTDTLLDHVDRRTSGAYDEQAAYTFIEMHFRFDLDGDGYSEPYIAKVHYGTGELKSLTKRFYEFPLMDDYGKVIQITPFEHFTQFILLPDIENNLRGMGLGNLLLHPVAAMNAAMNQMIDAGTKQNAGGGFYDSALRIHGTEQNIKMSLGEYTAVDNEFETDLRRRFYEPEDKGPSPALMSLLEFLNTEIERTSAVSDVMTGQQPPANTPATTILAMIEQGLQVYTATFEMLHHGLAQEIKKIRYLDAKHFGSASNPGLWNGTASQSYGMDGGYIEPMDHDMDGMVDVIPVSNPASATNTLKMSRSRVLLDIFPNSMSARSMLMRDMGVPAEDRKAIMEELQQQMQQVDPEVQRGQEEIAIERGKLELEWQRVDLSRHDLARKIAIERSRAEEMHTRAILNLAKAEAAEEGPQIDIYKKQLENIELERNELQSLLYEMMKGQENERGPIEQGGDIGDASEPPRSMVPPDIAPTGDINQAEEIAGPGLGGENSPENIPSGGGGDIASQIPPGSI